MTGSRTQIPGYRKATTIWKFSNVSENKYRNPAKILLFLSKHLGRTLCTKSDQNPWLKSGLDEKFFGGIWKNSINSM